MILVKLSKKKMFIRGQKGILSKKKGLSCSFFSPTLIKQQTVRQNDTLQQNFQSGAKKLTFRRERERLKEKNGVEK